MRIIFALFVITSGFIAKTSAIPLKDRLPDLHTCPSSKLQTCLLQSLESIRPYLAQGVPRLGIPVFEPYYTELYEMTFQNQFIPIMKFRDTYINGISNFTINNVRVANKNRDIQFFAHFPLITVCTKFDAYASFAPMLIKSSRYRLSSKFTNVVAEIIIRGTNFENEEENEQYFYVNNVTVTIKKFGRIKTTKEQRGSPERLMEMANNYLELEWDAVTSELTYNIEDIAADLVQIISNRIYTNFPIDVLMTS
ncbi:uncharacterized protein LOC105189928 [Harpegnathos saltator]|uniref:Circadian clock-controlled protein n=1 Tax=Harpegnathos saltator TaxID=610380 RepID=E2C4K1_HARSA|nr:uncharacterized protein LOC105189928 [Harpegnathos saltator]EFN77130.1 hypothetical protein EAI_06723 [Harpegnathos saltator]